MFRVHIQYRYVVSGVQVHEFLNLAQVIFRPIFITDKMYVEWQYANIIIRIESCFKAFIFTDMMYVKRQNPSSLS